MAILTVLYEYCKIVYVNFNEFMLIVMNLNFVVLFYRYRGFPDFSEYSFDLLNKRPYIANFVGTVYKGSSRESLVNLIEKNELADKVHLIYRNK